jgi:hypothetical protein
MASSQDNCGDLIEYGLPHDLLLHLLTLSKAALWGTIRDGQDYRSRIPMLSHPNGFSGSRLGQTS